MILRPGVFVMRARLPFSTVLFSIVPSSNVALSIVLLCLVGVPAFAGPLEDGLAAYKAKDWAKALALLRPLAEQGNAKAEERMGRLYERGVGVKRDYPTAEQWYRKSAEQGDAEAQARLAFLYRIGMGDVKRDLTEAAKWFRASAAQGNKLAQVGLGYMALEGIGAPLDPAVAASWFTKAAEQGDAEAQLALGTLYDTGKGVQKDRVQAYKWYSLGSVDDGEYDDEVFGRARRAKEGLVNRMTPAEIAQGEALVKDFNAGKK